MDFANKCPLDQGGPEAAAAAAALDGGRPGGKLQARGSSGAGGSGASTSVAGGQATVRQMQWRVPQLMQIAVQVPAQQQSQEQSGQQGSSRYPDC